MKELCIEPRAQFVEKVRCVLEVEVSVKNLISEDDMVAKISELFSSFDSAKISIRLFVSSLDSERTKVRLDIRSGVKDDYLIGIVELFLHHLGNVRIYHKKIEYRVSS